MSQHFLRKQLFQIRGRGCLFGIATVHNGARHGVGLVQEIGQQGMEGLLFGRVQAVVGKLESG